MEKIGGKKKKKIETDPMSSQERKIKKETKIEFAK